MATVECFKAATELHDQGLISAALLARITATRGEGIPEGIPGVPSVRLAAADIMSTSSAAARLHEDVISFPVFVRAHLLEDGYSRGAEEALVHARLDACSLAYVRGELEDYRSATDSLGAELLRSHPSIVEGPAGWFETELTALLEGLVQYYLGSTHWDRPDDVLKANRDDAQMEVNVAAEAAHAAMSRSWYKLRRSVWDSAVTRRLAATREFSTMSDILRSVATHEPSEVAAARRTLRECKPPQIVLLGGGMAAGKSTVVHKLKDGWADYIVIEADNFKMNDVIFRELNDRLTGDNEVSAMVHGASTDAANKQLIAALSAGRNIVLDGTMTWRPYVEQIVAMIRLVHKYRFRLGPGWVPQTKTEQYFVCGEQLDEPRHPYHIKMVGVTCDPAVAVSRGFRRKIVCGRGVPLESQLRSHRLYAQHFLDFVALVDEASLYDTTNETVEIARASVDNGRRVLKEERLFGRFLDKAKLNDKATKAIELFTEDESPGLATRMLLPLPAVPTRILELFCQ